MPRWILLGTTFLTLITAGCGAGSRDLSVTSPSPARPSPLPSGARLYLGYGSNSVGVGTTRQIYAFFTTDSGSGVDVTQQTTWESADTQVGMISATGLLEALQVGNVEVRGTYRDLRATWVLTIYRPQRTGPPGPDEVIGRVHETAPTDDVNVRYARVEVSGGTQSGRFVSTDFDGAFRIDGIQAPPFELVVSSDGYRSARYRIVELPRDAVVDIALEPAPGLVSEVFEGSVCAKNPSSTYFTPHLAAMFQVTSYRIAVFEDARISLLTNGVEAPRNPLQPGVTYEVRVSGDTDFCGTGGGPYNGVFRVTYLRPR